MSYKPRCGTKWGILVRMNGQVGILALQNIKKGDTILCTTNNGKPFLIKRVVRTKLGKRSLPPEVAKMVRRMKRKKTHVYFYPRKTSRSGC